MLHFFRASPRWRLVPRAGAPGPTLTPLLVGLALTGAVAGCAEETGSQFFLSPPEAEPATGAVQAVATDGDVPVQVALVHTPEVATSEPAATATASPSVDPTVSAATQAAADAAAAALLASVQTPATPVIDQVVISTPPATRTPDPLARSGPPVRLEVPSIGITAYVEQVGMTRDRKMDVPKGWQNVGWYREGARPGELGNAVLAGHLDDPSGSPAVFWGLDTLAPGDELYVTYQNGDRFTFVVNESRLYNFNESDPAAINTIFGPSQSANLNLITCEGVWDRGHGTYTQRRVVFTTLVPEKSVYYGGTGPAAP